MNEEKRKKNKLGRKERKEEERKGIWKINEGMKGVMKL